MRFSLGDVVVSQVVVVSIADHRFTIRPGTEGVIVDVHFGGHNDLVVLYEIDFALTGALYVRALAQEHEIREEYEIREESPLLH